MSEEYSIAESKQTDFGFRVDAQTEDPLRPDLPWHQASLHDLVMGGISCAGSQQDFIFPGSKITADGDYSHEIKRRLLLGKEDMTSLDSILKSRDINYFANKGPSSQSSGF